MSYGVSEMIPIKVIQTNQPTGTRAEQFEDYLKLTYGDDYKTSMTELRVNDGLFYDEYFPVVNAIDSLEVFELSGNVTFEIDNSDTKVAEIDGFINGGNIKEVIVDFDADILLDFGDYFLSNCDYLEDVVVKKVVRIGDGSFRYSKNSGNLSMPDLKFAGNEFLKNARVLTLDLPSLKEVGSKAFYSLRTDNIDLPNLDLSGTELVYGTWAQTVSLPKLKVMPDSSINGNGLLESISLDRLEAVSGYCFNANQELITLDMPEVTFIGNGSIENNPSLKEVNMPKLLGMGGRIIKNCDALEFVDLSTFGSDKSDGKGVFNEVSFAAVDSKFTLKLGENIPGVGNSSPGGFENYNGRLFDSELDVANPMDYKSYDDGDITDGYWYGFKIANLETTKPVLSDVSGESVIGRIKISFSASQAGDYVVAVVNDGYEFTDTQSVMSCSKGGDIKLVMANSSDGRKLTFNEEMPVGKYDVFIAYRNGDGNYSDFESGKISDIESLEDTSPPEIRDFEVTNITTTSGVLQFRVNEDFDYAIVTKRSIDSFSNHDFMIPDVNGGIHGHGDANTLFTYDIARLYNYDLLWPNSNYTVYFIVTGQDNEHSQKSISFTTLPPEPTNYAPVVDQGIKDQIGKVGNYFTFAFPENAFKDVNGDFLEYTVENLPDEISFDPNIRSFSGEPTTSTRVEVTVKATDPKGASVSTSFEIYIAPNSSSSDKKILKFLIYEDLIEGLIDEENKRVIIPVGVNEGDTYNRAPSTIELSEGASISPSVNEIQNFAEIVEYTVTAEDGTSQIWEVGLSDLFREDSSENDILSFRANNIFSSTVDLDKKEVRLHVPDSIDISSLTTTISTSDRSTVSPKSGLNQDFTNPIIYTVTAENGNQQEWKVYINNEIEKLIIDEDHITLELGDVYEIKANIYPDTATPRDITWGSEDNSVAYVYDGKNLTAQKVGVTWIGAHILPDDKFHDKVKVTVLPKSYIVTFDTKGGTTVAAIENVVGGSKITRPSNPSKSGYEFLSWMEPVKEGQVQGNWNFDTMKVEEDITLTAVWKKVSSGGSSSSSSSSSGSKKSKSSKTSSKKIDEIKKVEPTKKLLPENKKIENGIRKFDGQSQNIKNDKKETVLEIKPTKLEKGHTEISIPREVKDKKMKVNIATEKMNIKMDGDMFSGKEKSIKVDIEPKSVDQLNFTKESKKLIGDMPIYDISIKIDGKKVEWDSDKNIEIQMKVDDKGKEKHKFVAVYINPNGKVEILNKSYYNGKSLSFDTKHLSNYSAIYVDKSFDDISKHWSREAVEALAVRNIIKGTSDKDFSPEKSITRGEFVTLVDRYFEFEGEAINIYGDLDDNQYYFNPVARASSLGIVPNSYGDNFEPEKEISREDMMYILSGAIYKSGAYKNIKLNNIMDKEFEDVGDVSSYAKGSIDYLVKSGLLSGDNGRINPKNTASRGEVAQLIYNLLKESK
jgi:hypothetical protein